jgi:hypothetical protein
VEREPTAHPHAFAKTNSRERPVEHAYRLEVRGPLPYVAREELHRRFGDVQVRPDGDNTVVSGLTADQAALRATLSLLWDLGVEVRLVQATASADRQEWGAQS